MIINDVFDLKSLTTQPTPAPSKPIVGTSISIESSASHCQTPLPVSQLEMGGGDDVEGRTSEPTTWTI